LAASVDGPVLVDAVVNRQELNPQGWLGKSAASCF
jgi:hypothetical protein